MIVKIILIAILFVPVGVWVALFVKEQYGPACITALVGFFAAGVMMFILTASYTTIDKPILYLYPEYTQEISVKLSDDADILVSYPNYNDGWNVIAEPNGSLTDINTGRKLYALYWEEKYDVKLNSNEGFVVSNEDIIGFLEEKLAILGLNEREAEEFIVYWLPRLEKNNYYFIHFATEEELNEMIPIEITPKPDTMIRVYMEYKPVKENYKYVEQELDYKERVGYTSVEWGGIEL